MSHHSKGNDRNRDGSHHGNSGNSLQKKREREKMRRQQQYDEQEKAREPLFQPMRKMSRQDSLARTINNVLGDVTVVGEKLLRQPNSWYGTSRTRQGPSTANPAEGQVNASLATSATTNSQRGDGSLVTSSREALSSSDRATRSDSSISSGVYRSNEYDGRNNCKSKQQRDAFRDRHGQPYNKSSDLGKRQLASPHGKTSSDEKHLSCFADPSTPGEPSVAGILRSDRDRVSSIDSDMLSRVENIFEEMVDLPPSITDIKTPSVSERRNFNFTPSVQRKRGLDSNVENSRTDGPDAVGASDEDSSEDTSDEEKDDDDMNNDTDWNLESFFKEPKPEDSTVHSKNINSNCSEKSSNMDERSANGNSLPRKKLHMTSDTASAAAEFHRSFREDKSQSSSAQIKGRSRFSSSGQSHPSPRQRQSGTKDVCSNAKQSKAGTKRHSASSSSSRSESTTRSNKHKSFQKSPSSYNCTLNVPQPSDRLQTLHKSDETMLPTMNKDVNVSKEKRKSRPNVVADTKMLSKSGSTSSSSLESSSDESGSEGASDEERDSQSVFTNHSPKIDSSATKSNSPRNESTKKISRGSLSEENNLECASRKHNPSCNSFHGDDAKQVRTKPSYEKRSAFNPYKERHPHVSNPTTVKHDTAQVHRPLASGQSTQLALWVKLKSSLISSTIDGFFDSKKNDVSNASLSKAVDTSQPEKRQVGMVSTGSETEQPVRRADRVQVAVADGSTDWNDGSSINKRKGDFSDEAYDLHSHKRQRREKNQWKQHNRSFPREDWGGTADLKYNTFPPAGGAENYVDCQENTHPTSSLVGRESPKSSNVSRPLQRTSVNTASVVLPDSSVPGEQERIETSDWYMREGKKMKHEGDGMVDSRNGRTRPGEALNRALAYFEASLFFIMSGFVMESEIREERLETGSNSSSSTAHSPTNMYQQTLPLLDFVLKMRPHVEQDDRIFKRMTISCLRCQSYLYFRIFKLKKDIAVKNSDILTEQFKTVSKTAQTHSPWRNANAAPNVLSPMSPAVPSPFTHHGPSPASSNGDQVSSSTQSGKMTPSQHTNYSLPQKMYDTYRQHHTIMCNLLKAHEKWDQGESMMDEHVDFFHNIDALCNRTLTFHSSLRDVFLYYKMVLHQLRALMTSSPSA